MVLTFSVLLILVIGGYLIFAITLWHFQEKLIFFPTPMDVDIRNRLQPQALNASAADGTKLAGWVIQPPTPATNNFALLYFGGNNEQISDSLEHLAAKTKLPIGGLNYRGYGDSAGIPSADALREDALVAFDSLITKLGIKPQQVIVIGRSLGSHQATYVAGKRKVAGVILVTPFDSVLQVAKRRYPLLPIKMLLRHRFDNVNESLFIGAPTLIIGAEHDRVVPYAHAESLVEKWQGPNEIAITQVAEATHNDISDYDDYWEFIVAFIVRSEDYWEGY